MTTTNRNLQATKRKLERMELEHLRQHALELHEQLEQALERAERAEDDAQSAWISADFWQNQVMNSDDATHRCVGINKSGELMVVQMGGDHGEPGQH